MTLVAAVFRTLFLFLTGRVKFDRTLKGKTLTMPDGAQFTVFRRVEIQTGQPEPAAWFWVRFKPARMGVKANIVFSLLPMMVFMGFKGFRSKYWGVQRDTGLCQGLYEWQTVADAQAYAQSIAMRFMSNRSEPGSVEWGVVNKGEESLGIQIR